MATETPNYNLTKPDGSDVPDIEVLNGNMDRLDTSLKAINDAVSGLNTERLAVPDGMSLNDVGTGSWAVMSSRTHSDMPPGLTIGVLVVFSTGYGAFRGQVFIGAAGIWSRMRTGSLPGTWTNWTQP